ncbi:hypothetical protein, conserved [Leishmania tarentolae]|uniref:Trypanosoma Tc-38 (p38) protein domain-containing protein n=1 Tax=Leishmania tarentolae TaxID=5689 RepID=A0A640KMT9_LEITA|nr:hypothetical protein, conserved [Leishmania tarentolae]
MKGLDLLQRESTCLLREPFMPNSNVCLMKDVLGRSCPWWLFHLVPETWRAENSLQLLTTPAQRHQLRGHLCVSDGNASACAFTPNIDLQVCTSSAEIQVIMTHGRRLRMVSRNCGDVKLHVDLSNFLSCRGTCVTEVKEEAVRLAELTRRKLYASPFWLTQAQLESYFQNTSATYRTGCSCANSMHVCEVYQNPNASVELTCGTETPTRYANLDEFRARPHVPVSLMSCISFFRIFAPINVKTRRSFDPCVEWRLRLECQRSGCWCSVWGTAEDYASCGFSTLDGAIGVDVFDALGNPLFLIHALCTTAPLDIFTSCYPTDSVFTDDTF